MRSLYSANLKIKFSNFHHQKERFLSYQNSKIENRLNKTMFYDKMCKRLCLYLIPYIHLSRTPILVSNSLYLSICNPYAYTLLDEKGYRY
jgi:hypothetical protein